MPRLSPPLDPLIRERILSLSSRGAFPVEVAEETGVHYGTVYATLRKYREECEVIRLAEPDEVNWRERALETTKLLCLKKPQAHGVQRVASKGHKYLTLACGCRREVVNAAQTFTGGDANGKKKTPVFVDDED
jgi:hypothetical protein